MLPTGIQSMTRLRPDTPVKPAIRPDVEGLRAITVCLVVGSHFELGINGGFIGVDVFFVLSGFLITTQLLTSTRARWLAIREQFLAHCATSTLAGHDESFQQPFSASVLPSASLDQSDINTALPAGSSTFLPSGTTTAAAPHGMDRRALQAATTRFKQVVLQSSSISHVPSGLSLTLTQLGVSKGYQDALCHQDRCTYGTGPKKAILIGNSLADMMYPVVTNALDPAEWTVTIQWKSGCYLAFPSRCPTVFALPQSKIDLLVLSDYEGLNASTTAAQVEAGLAASVKEFSASSDHIVYIGQPPGLKAALVDCVNADLSFSSSCYSDRGAGDLIPEPGGSVTTINALKSRLVTAAGGVFVDPTTWLCTQGQCPPVIGNYPVYVDTQHLDSQLSAQKLSMFFRLDLMTADIVI